MKLNNIIFILVQIDEAHSSAWPVGLENQPDPQESIEERIEKANTFATTELTVNDSIYVYVDTWQNDFAETYHAWPDKYYCVDATNTVLVKSEYGNKGQNNAKIKIDCIDVLLNLMNKHHI